MHPLPIELRKTGDGQLGIRWNDGREQLLPFRVLRRDCPCATCREKAMTPAQVPGKPASLPILSAADVLPLDIVRMSPVGNYAYNIAFSDGHSSGIFTFEFLRALGHFEGETTSP